jgi:hypothetical protein
MTVTAVMWYAQLPSAQLNLSCITSLIVLIGNGVAALQMVCKEEGMEISYRLTSGVLPVRQLLVASLGSIAYAVPCNIG